MAGAPSRRAARARRYGYAYPCQAAGGGLAEPSVCALNPTDFRGAPCSDAAGAQKEYSELMRCARPLGLGQGPAASKARPAGFAPRLVRLVGWVSHQRQHAPGS